GAGLGDAPLRLEAEVAQGRGGGGVAGGDVAGAPGGHAVGYLDPGGLLEGADRLQHRGAPAGAEVADPPPGGVAEVLQRGQVPAGQGHDVPVVAGPGAVGGGVVV